LDRLTFMNFKVLLSHPKRFYTIIELHKRIGNTTNFFFFFFLKKKKKKKIKKKKKKKKKKKNI